MDCCVTLQYNLHAQVKITVGLGSLLSIDSLYYYINWGNHKDKGEMRISMISISATATLVWKSSEWIVLRSFRLRI